MTVSPADLTGTERAVLLVLMAESRPVPNPDLLALGPKLDKPGRDKLNELGLIESQRSGGRFVHELTDRGWRLCRDITTAGPPPRSTGPGKTLYTVLGARHRYLRRADLSLADVFGADDDEANRRPNTSFDMPMPDSCRGPADGSAYPASHRACRHPAGRARRRPADAESQPRRQPDPRGEPEILMQRTGTRPSSSVITPNHLLAIEL